MDRVLYIGENTVSPSNGGEMVNYRNISALREIYGVNLYVYPLLRVNKYITFINMLFGNLCFMKIGDYRNIYIQISRLNIDMIFLSSSKMGKLACRIKNKFPKIKIVSFFHNIEWQYYQEEIMIDNTLKNRILMNVVVANERKTVQNSDILITLNKRDSKLMRKIYGKEVAFELPISFIDCYDTEKASHYKPLRNNKLNLLFVGYNFFANVHGIKWFIDNVLSSFQNAHLTIVGTNMDLAFTSDKQVTVFGYVEDLSSFYYNTDIVIQPIFYGGGMKTKTAEALMYGCPIIGTKESFEGYELEYDKIGGLANNKDDMIDRLNELFNDSEKILDAREYARRIFKSKYSIDQSIKTLSQFLL